MPESEIPTEPSYLIFLYLKWQQLIESPAT